VGVLVVEEISSDSQKVKHEQGTWFDAVVVSVDVWDTVNSERSRREGEGKGKGGGIPDSKRRMIKIRLR
jgi:hypothetical protein